MNPRISIIVPVYKVEPYIHNCIDSILAQTFKDFELILVDDGSPDKSGEICDEYAKKDNRIQVIHKKNEGVSTARNLGIDIAKGEYIAFVDPDDTVEHRMYDVLLSAAQDHRADLVVCPIKTINNILNTTSISSVWENVNCTIKRKTIENSIIPSVLNDNSYSLLSSCNKLYRKTFFDNYEIRFDESRHHGEDARLNLLLLMKINVILFVENPFYNYYIRKRNSLTQTFREDLYSYILDNKNFGVYLCQKYNVTQFIDKILNNYILITLNYMQDVVNTNISINKKYDILSIIMNDSEFQKHLVNSQCPNTFCKLLKRICIQKNEKLFLKIVKTKNKLKYLASMVS